MRIHLISVGRRMPSWIEEGFQEYAKRLPHECSLALIEIDPAKRAKSTTTTQARQEEGQRILKAVPKGAAVIALDEHGKGWTTEALSSEMASWMGDGRDRALLVGGADGLASDCLQRAERCWSLSPMTFPHPLVRVILAEQVYRAWTLLQGHPYHRGG